MEYETNPTKAIRKKCLDCCMGQAEEVKQCPIEDCDLYPYRFGKNPFRAKREYSEEEKERLRSNLEKVRYNRSKNKD